MKKKLVFGALTVALVLSATAFATADTATINGALNTGTPPKLESKGTVNVKATINPKLVLTITTTDTVDAQTVNFGTVDPGNTYTGNSVALNVKSNKDYDLSTSIGGGVPIGLSTSLNDAGALTAQSKTASQNYTDNYKLVVPWTTAPNTYAATVQYTVTQN